MGTDGVGSVTVRCHVPESSSLKSIATENTEFTEEMEE
jgi:hypothetical protein